jgi:hypothetical protein
MFDLNAIIWANISLKMLSKSRNTTMQCMNMDFPSSLKGLTTCGPMSKLIKGAHFNISQAAFVAWSGFIVTNISITPSSGWYAISYSSV